MNKYICRRVVDAEAMTRGDYNQYRGWQLPADEDGSDAGYLIAPAGAAPGYVQWMPEGEFNRTHSLLKGMNFSDALEIVKVGVAICRSGWNGKDQYVFRISTDEMARVLMLGHARMKDVTAVDPVLALKNAQGGIQLGWAPSQGDLFANDWEIYKWDK